jgi:hypothetical protein
MVEAQPFDLSVLVPLEDDRDQAEACLASWNAQSHPRERIQLVVVGQREELDAGARLGALLRPWDLWLTIAGRNEAVVYDAGARAAAAPLLLFTESHAVALPAAAATTIGILRRGDADAVSLRSGHLRTTVFGRRQEELEDEWYPSLGPGHWRSLSLRGLAISRELFCRLGGFRAEHERFAETVLGVALHQGGHRIAGTDETLVLHGNSRNAAELEEGLRSCARGQWRWRVELETADPGMAEGLLGPPLVSRWWLAGSEGGPATIRAALLRASATWELAAARAASVALVRAGRAGRWAFRAHWRAAYRYGLVEAVLERLAETGTARERARAPVLTSRTSAAGDT